MLTIAEVKNAKPQPAEYLLADGRGGLYLRVLPSGAKSWLYRYSLDGKKRKLSLGLYPDISLAEAREKHAEARQSVRRCVDPAAPPTTQQPADQPLTTAGLIEKYLFSLRQLDSKTGKTFLSDSTINESERVLNKYVLPVIGTMPAREVRRPDAISLIERYLATPGQARSVMKITRAMFTWGLNRAYVDFNPITQVVATIPAIKPREKTRTLSDTEIKHFWKAILAEKDPRSLSTRRALLMILVTGQRPAEVSAAVHEEISVGVIGKNRCKMCRRCGWWTIQWQRIKTRNTREQNHRVYLSPLALSIISSEDHGAIFPNNHNKVLARHALSHYVADHNCWGLEKFTPHDLRRTAATKLSELECPDAIIDAILNHVKQGTIKIYNQNKYDREKEYWLTVWSDHLQSLLSTAS